MKILKARIDWGEPIKPGVHYGRPPQLHILVDALPDSEWVYAACGASYRRFYFAEQGGEARFLRQGPDGLTPWGRVSLRLQDGSTVEFDPRPLDPSTVNYLAYDGKPGFQQIVPVILKVADRENRQSVAVGPRYVTLDFAREAAAKCEPPVFLAQERFGWDDSSWRWVPSVVEERPTLPGEILEETP